MDSNNNGVIDYTEFIAACMCSKNYTQEKKIRQAFEHFDRDKSGAISSDELKECLHNDDFTMTDEQINDLIKEVDQNDDG
jgi:calcium-dependent protein kinase